MPPVRDRSKSSAKHGARSGSTSPPWWYTTELQSTRKMAEQHAQDVKRIDLSLCGIQRRISESTQNLAQRMEALEADRAADGASWASSAGGSRLEAQVRRLDAMAVSMTNLEASVETFRSQTDAQIASLVGTIEEFRRQSGTDAVLPTDGSQAYMKNACVDRAKKELHAEPLQDMISIAKLTQAMFETGDNSVKESKVGPPTGTDASTEQMEDLLGNAIQKCVRGLLPQLKTYAASNRKSQLGRVSNASSPSTTLECIDGVDRMSPLKPESEFGTKWSSRAATDQCSAKGSNRAAADQCGGITETSTRRGVAATPNIRQFEGCKVDGESGQGSLAGGMQRHAALEVCSRVEASAERFRNAQQASPQPWSAAALSPASSVSSSAARQPVLKGEPHWRGDSMNAPPVSATGADAPDTEFCKLLADRLASRQEMVPSPAARSLRFHAETPNSHTVGDRCGGITEASILRAEAATPSIRQFEGCVVDGESSQGSLAGSTQKHAALAEVCSRVEASVERFRSAQQASPQPRSATALSPASPASSGAAGQSLLKAESFWKADSMSAETPSDSEDEALAPADRGVKKRHTVPPSHPLGRGAGDSVVPWHSRRLSEQSSLPPNWQPLESVKTPRLNRES